MPGLDLPLLNVNSDILTNLISQIVQGPMV